MPLKLSAEPFAASGGMAGEGARKLLGAPTLSPLQIVVREAGQNSWDARRDNGRVRFEIKLRQPDKAQWKALQREIFAELPESAGSRDALEKALGATRPLLLEISDYGTKGLGGPTRADVAVSASGNQNFVNFVRNIGAGQHRPLGGGTYGFGKTSFYDLDPCATIIVDSLALVDGGIERRLIACHLGNEFNGSDNHRYTGRHWWGVPTGNKNFVEPLRNREASDLADAIGLPARNGDADTGTTISVLVPGIGSEREAIGTIVEAMLWFFWPKMIAEAGQPVPMEFALRKGDAPVPIPAPEQFPPLELFVEAWRQLKAGERVKEIRLKSPKKLLGKLSIARGFRNERHQLHGEPLVPGTVSHVALMRPVELVVKYLKAPALPSGSHEWAGVFICSEETEVERAFATSEPPAHDDWIPENLPSGRSRTYVKMGLQRIVEAVNAVIFPGAGKVTGAADQPPLGKAAAYLGTMAPLAPKDVRARSTRTQHGSRRRWSVSPAVFVSLEEADSAVDAIFRVEVRNRSAEPLVVEAKPGVVAEDTVGVSPDAPGGGVVTIVAWETAEGEVLATGNQYQLAAESSADVRLRVRIPEPVAVGVQLEVTD